jgi:four helix bundle protein
MSYRNLEVWQLAKRLTTEVHVMTIEKLPRLELYEEGAQLRRLTKSIRSNIVEGYGRRRYKHDFIRFLTYALASCDESTDHLEILRETGSLKDPQLFESIHEQLDELGRKLNNLIQSVERDHQSVREPTVASYADPAAPAPPNIENPDSSIEHRESSIEDPES